MSFDLSVEKLRTEENLKLTRLQLDLLVGGFQKTIGFPYRLNRFDTAPLHFKTVHNDDDESRRWCQKNTEKAFDNCSAQNVVSFLGKILYNEYGGVVYCME